SQISAFCIYLRHWFFNLPGGCSKPARYQSLKKVTLKKIESSLMLEQYPKIYLCKRIVQAKLFIDNNYSQKINLNNISDEACFSKFHFLRLFKSVYGKTPHQYLIKTRIENAKYFLRGGYGISDTCFQVGFDSITSFTGLFKKCEGKTPSEYLKQNKIREE